MNCWFTVRLSSEIKRDAIASWEMSLDMRMTGISSYAVTEICLTAE